MCPGISIGLIGIKGSPDIYSICLVKKFIYEIVNLFSNLYHGWLTCHNLSEFRYNHLQLSKGPMERERGYSLLRICMCLWPPFSIYLRGLWIVIDCLGYPVQTEDKQRKWPKITCLCLVAYQPPLHCD